MGDYSNDKEMGKHVMLSSVGKVKEIKFKIIYKFKLNKDYLFKY